MNEKQILTQDKFLNAAIGDDVSILNEIHQKEKNISIYRREIDFIKSEISGLESNQFEYRESGDKNELLNSLENELGKLLDENSQLLSDIKECLEIFSTISKAKAFRLLLATVNTNMCRRFHIDVNDLRLLCTYSGPGTIWLPDEIVNRKSLHSGKENDDIVKDSSKIQQANTGYIVILKGAVYPAEGTKAIAHRSPTIEESGKCRLLLRIDTDEFLKYG